jgi:hypothetical protein
VPIPVVLGAGPRGIAADPVLPGVGGLLLAVLSLTPLPPTIRNNAIRASNADQCNADLTCHPPSFATPLASSNRRNPRRIARFLIFFRFVAARRNFANKMR